MRTHYRLEEGDEKVASSSVEKAKNYHLPTPNYLKAVPVTNFQRHLQRDVDNTYNRSPYVPIKIIDTRKQKF